MAVDRSRRPRSGPVRPFSFPNFVRHRLANGIQMLVVTDHSVPLVHLELVIGTGCAHDPLARRGLSSLAAALLDEGTGERDALDIASHAEGLGAHLVTSADWDGIYVGTSSLTPHAPELLDLCSQLVRTPSLPQHELDRLRGMRIADLADRSTRPAFVAARQAVNMLYGTDHPYGDTQLGTPESLAAITREDVVAWHRERFAPEHLTIVAVGDVDLDELIAWAEPLSGAWPRSEACLEPVAATPPATAMRRIRIVDRPEAPQTELRVARVGLARSAPDYLEARILSLALGGKFTSRLNLNLREERGITYGVHSRLSGRRGPGPFSIGCALDSEAAGIAIGEILREMDDLAQHPLPAEELADTRNYLLGTFPYQLQALDGIADHLEELILYDLPDDTFHRLPDAVLGLSPEDLRGTAEGLMRTDDLAIVAVGPAATLEPLLAPFGPTERITENGSKAPS